MVPIIIHQGDYFLYEFTMPLQVLPKQPKWTKAILPLPLKRNGHVLHGYDLDINCYDYDPDLERIEIAKMDDEDFSILIRSEVKNRIELRSKFYEFVVADLEAGKIYELTRIPRGRLLIEHGDFSELIK